MSNGTYGTTPTATHASGWVTFAGVLMVIGGFFQAMSGLVALFKPTLYVASTNQLLVLNYRQWGWTHLIIGILLLVSSYALFTGRLWGRIVAIALATLSAIANFAFIAAYPFWSITIIVLDVLIIYGVATYGSEQTE